MSWPPANLSQNDKRGQQLKATRENHNQSTARYFGHGTGGQTRAHRDESADGADEREDSTVVVTCGGPLQERGHARVDGRGSGPDRDQDEKTDHVGIDESPQRDAGTVG